MNKYKIDNMKKLVLFFTVSLLLFFSACVKQKFDAPPISEIPVGGVYTISQLRQMYADSGAYQFKTAASVYATVTMDESSGNIYKSAYVQDAGDAVNLHLEQTGGLRVGDSIRIYLKNVVLSDYNGMFQLDNVNNDSSIVILATQKFVTPKDVTIEDLLANKYQEQLVKLNDVQFAVPDTGKVFAEPNSATNRKLEDCSGNRVDVRTSSYATFAIAKVPDKRGSLVAIVGTFNGNAQLYLRSLSEVVMDSTRCEPGSGGTPISPVDSVHETFDDAVNYADIAIDGWTNIKVAGDRSWQGKVFKTDKYAQATGYNSGLTDMETWLITPPVVNTNGDKVLHFISAKAYWTHTGNDKPLTVLASTDFDGTNFATATWTELSPTLADASGSDNAWVKSGNISLANFVGNVAIAFKYKGSNTESTTMRIDNVVVGKAGGNGGGGTVITPVDSIHETFDNAVNYVDIAIAGWTNEKVAGDRSWQGKVFKTDKYAQATGYNSGLTDMETWLITPPVVNTNGDKVLHFISAKAYWTHTGNDKPLIVLASTDFDGTNFATATWTELSPTLADAGASDNAWIKSGSVSLANFVGNVAIAFKYKGSNTESTTMRIDDVVVSNGNGSGGGGGGGGTPGSVTSFDVNFSGQTNNADIALTGWLNVATSGSRLWRAKKYNTNLYAQGTAYKSTEENISWLITPKIDLDAMTSPAISFDTEKAYWSHVKDKPFEVLISTDFDGTNIASATWTEINAKVAVKSDADNAWIKSGDVDLSSYSGKVYIAFRYYGDDTKGETTSYRIDNIKLYNK